MDRRQTLGLMGSLLTTLALPTLGHATTARAVSLSDLVARSSRIARATPLDSFSRFDTIGDTRQIVTYTRLGVDDLIHGAAGEREILVRTLGGSVDKISEIVHGEAVLAMNEPCVVFLHTSPEGIDQVTAMAQGHYPLLGDAGGTLRLSASRNMPSLVGAADAAVIRLAGLPVTEARALIVGARR